MGMIYKRGDVYWIKFYNHGIPEYESSKSDKYSEARALLREREEQVEKGKFVGQKRASMMTFEKLCEKLIDDYENIKHNKSTRRAELSIKNLKKYFSGKKVSTITDEDIELYIKNRRENGRATGTINRELSALKRMFSLVAKKGIACPDIPKLPENNVRSGFFEPQEFFKLREALPDYLKPVLTIAYHTGMRKEEILSLTWGEVDLIEGRIILESGRTKNNKQRTIPLTGELYEIVAKQKELRDSKYPECGYVFFKEGLKNKLKKVKRPYYVGDFRKTWKTALRQCGYKPTFKCRECNMVIELPDGKKKEEITCPKCNSNQLKTHDRLFHDLRRSALRRMVRVGITEKVAMAISGHKRRDVFERYNIVTENDVRLATEKLMASHREIEKNFSQAPATVTKTVTISDSEPGIKNASQ
jgi:integrase